MDTYCCPGIIVISALLGLFSGYAYLVNNRYTQDDLEWEDYDLLAVFLTPFTWIFLVVSILVFVMTQAVFFGVFLLVFSTAMALIRKPFFWPWIEPTVLRIGRGLLKANTFLIKLFERDH